MKEWKRLVYYLFINILVSACTTFAVLYFWDRTHPLQAGEPSLVAMAPASAGGQVISATLTMTGTLQSAAVSLPTGTPTTDPYENAIKYIVKPDDTMGVIADRFDVPLDVLLSYNQLKDPNALSVGQPIYIPVTPEPGIAETQAATSTPQSQATGQPQASGSPAATAQPAHIVITAVIGPGDLSAEHVFLSLTGEGEISLAGWKLEDQNGNAFTFPQLQLYKGAINVWTQNGTPNAKDLYWGLQSPVWQSGETVTLRDDKGKVQATYKIP
jgi:LysM repeat protein